MALARTATKEVEVFGVTYERFALARLFSRFVDKLGIQTVIELPASGAKAMPSLYSLGFALAGCQVTLVDADTAGVRIWQDLGLSDRLHTIEDAKLDELVDDGRRWDLCWNFAVLPTTDDPNGTAQRMIRCTNRYWMVVNVNRYNVGFYMHRTVHRLWNIPWTHGDLNFFSPFKTVRFMKQLRLNNIRWGVVDCPPWPDSPGFRDLRLHRTAQEKKEWVSPYTAYLRDGDFPGWMKWVYLGERLPIPPILKLPYAHLYYALGQVDHEVNR
jgi:hypothetical protein